MDFNEFLIEGIDRVINDNSQPIKKKNTKDLSDILARYRNIK